MAAATLPERADVWWRRPMDERRLRQRERLSTAFTATYVLPFCVIGAVLLLIEPGSSRCRCGASCMPG